MGVTPLNSVSEYKDAINNNKLVLVDCYADWCGPCKVIAPVLDKFSESYTGTKFCKLDVDNDNVSTVALELEIRAMPTIVLFEDGKEASRVIGANQKAIEAAIKGLIASAEKKKKEEEDKCKEEEDKEEEEA